MVLHPNKGGIHETPQLGGEICVVSKMGTIFSRIGFRRKSGGRLGMGLIFSFGKMCGLGKKP